MLWRINPLLTMRPHFLLNYSPCIFMRYKVKINSKIGSGYNPKQEAYAEDTDQVK